MTNWCGWLKISHHPAGVEWQGLFEEDDDEGKEENESYGVLGDSESEDDDYGHYSLVIHANRRKKQLIIADPYKDYFSQARIFGFHEFDARWYDFNEVPDSLTGEPRLVKDDHMMFVIARRSVIFPRLLGMQTY